jgi:carboxymethylenebutenolidase
MAYKKREEIEVEHLNDMQRYLGEETIEDYQSGQMSRRRMLRRLILICGSAAGATALLAACGDATATITSATTAPAATTGAAATTAASTTTAAATTAAATTTAASTTTAAAVTTAASGTTAAASGTTAAAAATQGQAKGPLTVAATDPAVEATDITIQGDTTILAYMAKPKAAGTYPGVIVIHENRGLTDHIKDVARRFAKAGFIAIAPDLASRNGGTAKVPTDQVSGYFANAKPDDLVKDLTAAQTYLETVTGVKTGKYGVVGFCYGGGMALRLAAANPKIAAAVPYYGPVPTPVTQMATTKAAILGIYGGNDARLNASIPDLEKTLKDAGKTFEKKIYDGANHAFNNDTGANFNENAAVTAWGETLNWLQKYL